MSTDIERSWFMDGIIAFLLALILVDLIQWWVYCLYLKTKHKKRALLPNFLILFVGFGVSALVVVLNRTMSFEWNHIVMTLFLSLTLLSFLISLGTSLLMLYTLDLLRP